MFFQEHFFSGAQQQAFAFSISIHLYAPLPIHFAVFIWFVRMELVLCVIAWQCFF